MTLLCVIVLFMVSLYYIHGAIDLNNLFMMAIDCINSFVMVCEALRYEVLMHVP